jgi:predicted ATPase
VVGKQVHDARLVAICHVHAVTHLLTFNVGHFVRMGFGPGVVIVDPATVSEGSQVPVRRLSEPGKDFHLGE